MMLFLKILVQVETIMQPTEILRKDLVSCNSLEFVIKQHKHCKKTERNVKILYNWFSEVCKESRKCTKFRHLNWICTMQGFSFQEEDVTVPNTNQRLWENISGASLVTFVNMAIGTTLLNQWFSHRREVLMSKRKQLKSEGKGNRKRKTLAQDDFIKLRESAS